jgi:hypothetical protein
LSEQLYPTGFIMNNAIYVQQIGKKKCDEPDDEFPAWMYGY